MNRSVSVVVLCMLLVTALGVQARSLRVAQEAERLHRAAIVSSRPWNERVQDARSAVALRPDVIAYRQRAASIQASRYVEVGALDQARETLIEAWALNRSATYLRRQLTEVNSLILARDSRKAHLLHGREKPGGVLEPDDLLP